MPSARLNVTSRKSTVVLFASIVIFKLLSLNVLHIVFFMFSISLGDSLHMASPSSLDSAMLCLMLSGSSESK